MRLFDLLSPRARRAIRTASQSAATRRVLPIAELSATGLSLPSQVPLSGPTTTTTELGLSERQAIVAFVLSINWKGIGFASPLTAEEGGDPKCPTDIPQDAPLQAEQETALSLKWSFTLRDLLNVDHGLLLDRLQTGLDSKILLWFIASPSIVSIDDETEWVCLTWIPLELPEIHPSQTALLRLRLAALKNYLMTVLPFRHITVSNDIYCTWPSLRQAIHRVLHLSPSYGALQGNGLQAFVDKNASPILFETSNTSGLAAHPPLQLLGAITTEVQRQQNQDLGALASNKEESTISSSRAVEEPSFYLRLCANVTEILAPYLSPSTNRSELSYSVEASDSPMQLEPGYAIVFSVDDTNALVKADCVIPFETVGQLESALNTTEPRYYLARFFNTTVVSISRDAVFAPLTALFLFNPGCSLPILRFMYPFFKKTVRKLLEMRFQLTIDRAADLRKGDPVNIAFRVERPLEIDIGKQVLSVSETAVRPRPPTTTPIIDPFLRIQTCSTNIDLLSSDNATSDPARKEPQNTSYNVIPAHQRFHF